MISMSQGFAVIAFWLFVPLVLVLLFGKSPVRLRFWHGFYKTGGIVPAPLSPEQLAERPIIDLKDFWHREMVTRMLQRNNVIGDADIRNGTVLPTVNPAHIDPLARMFKDAYDQIDMTPNAVNGSLYFAVKNPGEGTGWTYRCCGMLTASDLIEAVQLLQNARRENPPVAEKG